MTGLLALLLIIAAFFALDLGHWLSLASIKSRLGELGAWRAAQPLAAASGFFAIYVAVTALSLPGATVMTLAAGALFGLGWGTLIVSFAASIGATLAFLAARWLLGGWIQASFGARLATLNAGIARDGAFYLFTLRLVPVFPFFLINLAMGITPLRPWTFYWVSQLGMLAGTVVFVNAGTQLARIESLRGIVSPGVLVSLALLGVFPLLAKKALAAFQSGRDPARPRWQRPRRFDRNLVVIGAGSAGLVSAYIAAALKARVTLVEDAAMGGDCLNTGCVPSKALIRTTRLVAQMRDAAEFGLRPAAAEFDFAEVMERVQRVIRAVAPHDSVARYTALGVEVALGRARIVTPWEVEITHHDGRVQRLSTRAIVIATGGRPAIPAIAGIEQVEVLTSDTVWALRQRPERLLVLGGGPIGCEMAQAFARLGCRVTLLEAAPRLLMREDPEVGEGLAQRLRAEGLGVMLEHQAERIEIVDGRRVLVASHAGAEHRLEFDALLVGTGRTARLSGYGLEELGVRTGRTIEVDACMRTSVASLYAAGDVAGPYQFTHTASLQAWYATVNALFAPFKRFRIDYGVIPWTTFVDPEVARVGLNETEARAQGVPFELTRFELAELDRAIADGATQGFVKVLTVPGRDRILGVTLVGEHAGDLLAEWVLAMKQGIGLNKILGTIHVYPTWAEANKAAAGAWKRAHAPAGLLRWVERFHRWRRD